MDSGKGRRKRKRKRRERNEWVRKKWKEGRRSGEKEERKEVGREKSVDWLPQSGPIPCWVYALGRSAMGPHSHKVNLLPYKRYLCVVKLFLDHNQHVGIRLVKWPLHLYLDAIYWKDPKRWKVLIYHFWEPPPMPCSPDSRKDAGLGPLIAFYFLLLI